MRLERRSRLHSNAPLKSLNPVAQEEKLVSVVAFSRQLPDSLFEIPVPGFASVGMTNATVHDLCCERCKCVKFGEISNFPDSPKDDW